jgi:hypothetical protein
MRKRNCFQNLLSRDRSWAGARPKIRKLSEIKGVSPPDSDGSPPETGRVREPVSFTFRTNSPGMMNNIQGNRAKRRRKNTLRGLFSLAIKEIV